MRILTLSTCRFAAVVAFSIAVAASNSISSAQTPAPASTVATYICRPAQAGEKATATMADSATKLECRPFAVSMRMGDGSTKIIGNAQTKPQQGPDLSHALTADQIREACAAWLYRVLKIDPATVHTP